MALRLIEVVLPEGTRDGVRELLKDRRVLGLWDARVSEDQVLVRVLLPTEETEPVLDLLEKQYSMVDGFRIILLPVVASIPRPEIPEKTPPQQQEPQAEESPEKKITRISREELYADIVLTTRLSTIYLVMIVLSSLVAAIGLLQSNVAVIIGAMVIAPLLGPNVALSLATTLGDIALARSALKANGVGVLTALILSALLGFLVAVNPEIPEIASRTRVGLGDIILALASGGAGALAFTTGVSAALIGVMVAVALLPPVVTFGLLMGAGHLQMASGAMLLVLTNVICVNLAGVTAFLAQGIRPITWWEADRAKKATRIAIVLWVFLLSVLVVVIILSQRS